METLLGSVNGRGKVWSGLHMGLQSSMFHVEVYSCYITAQLGETIEDNGKDKCFLDQMSNSACILQQ